MVLLYYLYSHTQESIPNTSRACTRLQQRQEQTRNNVDFLQKKSVLVVLKIILFVVSGNMLVLVKVAAVIVPGYVISFRGNIRLQSACRERY